MTQCQPCLAKYTHHIASRVLCGESYGLWPVAGTPVSMRPMAGPGQQPVRLSGREQECAVIDRLLAGARAGTGGALVVRGEPGIGKSALIGYAR